MGCAVAEAASGQDALRALARQRFDIAFVDLRLGTEDGLAVLSQLLRQAPRLEVVLITAYGTIDSAVEAMRRGARDYLTKPFTPPQIRALVERLARQLHLEHRLAALELRLAEALPEIQVESASPAMRAALDLLVKAAGHDTPVLLLGESGTGKGLLARALHRASPRRDRPPPPFVVVNCPTLSEEPARRASLFGHVKGAFTGAVRDQEGRVETAEGGTLFLDEIAEIPPGLQAKLLRFLQDKQFERLGEGRTRIADVRIVAATNRNLQEEVRAARFREDLYYRLNTLEVIAAPLRERTDDVLPLAHGFLVTLAREMRRCARASVGRSPGHPGELPLAGQRPRAAQHAGARHDPRARPGSRTRVVAQAHRGRAGARSADRRRSHARGDRARAHRAGAGPFGEFDLEEAAFHTPRHRRFDALAQAQEARGRPSAAASSGARPLRIRKRRDSFDPAAASATC